MFERKVTIYQGDKEYKGFEKTVEAWTGLKPTDKGKDCDGQTVLWFAWVEDPDNKRVIFHELSHIIDNILECLNIKDSEVRAYLSAYLHEGVLDKKNRIGVTVDE
jgi:hypothetical protein